MAHETEHPLVRTLAARMSDISEECWCAGWMDGNEYALWDAVLNGPRRYGMGYISQDLIDELKALSDIIGGWVCYGPGSPDGAAFIPMQEWLKKYEWYQGALKNGINN